MNETMRDYMDQPIEPTGKLDPVTCVKCGAKLYAGALSGGIWNFCPSCLDKPFRQVEPIKRLATSTQSIHSQ